MTIDREKLIEDMTKRMNYRAVQAPYDLRNHTPMIFYEEMARTTLAVIEPILAAAEGMRRKAGIVRSRLDALLEGDCPCDADIMLSEEVGEALKAFDVAMQPTAPSHSKDHSSY